MSYRLRVPAAATLTAALASAAVAADDPLALFNAVPAPPASIAAARGATELAPDSGAARLSAPAYAALETKVKRQVAAAGAPQGAPGGIDLARAASDPAYAAQIQARMQSMSTAEKMAMAQQMSGGAAAASPAGGGAAMFLATQRAADQAAQARMRALLEAALSAAGAKHRAADQALDAAAKACPTDKTGWPQDACTAALGEKSITQHRAIEEAALAQEGKAFADARVLAGAELAKGRSALSQAQGNPTQTGPLTAWVMSYTELLREYGEAMTVRAGFWAHADQHKYTGHVSVYVGNPDLGVVWPLSGPPTARTGL